MKAKNLRALSSLELESKLLELKKEMMKMNSQVAIGAAPKNSSRIHEIKRTMAQIYTIKNQVQARNVQTGGVKKE